MTRQDQFKAEMADLLAKYKVEINVEEQSDRFYGSIPSAISFFAVAEYDENGNATAEGINFEVGSACVDHTDFE